jgi:hypothetical protein
LATHAQQMGCVQHLRFVDDLQHAACPPWQNACAHM